MYTFDWLHKHADLMPHKIALQDVATGRSFTYLDFHLRASRIARFLQTEWQVTEGDRVALLAHNCTEYMEILYGCAKIGAILVCLNWRLAVPELEFIINDSAAKGLIYDGEFADTAVSLTNACHIKFSLSMDDYETAVTSMPNQPIVMPPTPLDKPWFILYTSGTTGKPKGVIQTHGMVFYNALNIGLPTRMTADDTSLNLLPFFHTGGLNLHTNPTIFYGGTAVIQRTFDPQQTFQLLAENITMFFGVPVVYLFLSQHPDFEQTQFGHVRSWACGGSPMSVSLLEKYAARDIIIQQGFGMTETGPTVFLVDAEHAVAKAGSVGKPQLFAEVRIVDKESNDVLIGEKGELLVKGPAVTPGYWQRPDLTAAAITSDGWLHTGDVARQDEDGYFYIVDRWKDMYISGGENVYPAEVENVLFYHTAVSDVAVIGVADVKWGEVGLALIVLEQDQTISEIDLLDFCRDKLAKYKIPKQVVFVDDLPRTAAGKVRKMDLRAQYS